MRPGKTAKAPLLSALTWLIREELFTRKMDCLAVIIANFIGVTSGTLAFGVLFVYVRARAGGNALPAHGFAGLAASLGGTGILSCSLFALVLGLASAACGYYAKRRALEVARDFHARAALMNYSELYGNEGEKKDRGLEASCPMLSPRHDARHIPTLYARHAATVLRLLLEAGLPLVTAVVALAGLVIFSPLVTLALVPLAMLYVACFAFLSRRGASLLREYQQSTASATASARSSDEDAYTAVAESWNKNLDALYDQILLSRQSLFANQVFQIVSMVWLVVIFGHCLKTCSADWQSLLVFLIALRFLWQSLRKLSALLVEVGRFAPSVQVYARFMCR